MADPISHARPPGAVKLFVGQIPRSFNEDQIRAIFEEYGSVHEVVIIRDKTTGASKGCAFVIYTSRGDADRAIQTLNNLRCIPPMENPMQVKYADGEVERLEHKIFVGMIPKTATETDLIEIFGNYGQVVECIILRDNQGNSKGCGFVKMENKQQAVAAISALHQQHKITGGSLPLTVKFADTEKDKHLKKQQQAIAGGMLHSGYLAMNPSLGYFNPAMGSASPGTGPPGANLFVFHLPKTLTDQDLQNLFSPFGRILSVKVFRDKKTGEHKGFGFVSFDNAQSAQMAIVVMNGFEVGSKRLKVEIKKPNAVSAAGGSPIDSAATAAQAAVHGQSQQGLCIPTGLLGLQPMSGLANSLLSNQQMNMNQAMLAAASGNRVGLSAFNHLAAQGMHVPGLVPPAFPNSIGLSPLGTSFQNLQLGKKDEPGTPISGPQGANLFVFHLPGVFTDQDMLNAFSPFGRILSVKVFYDKVTGEQKGFGFVSYDSPAAAQAAIAAMNGLSVGGKRLKVQLKKGEGILT